MVSGFMLKIFPERGLIQRLYSPECFCSKTSDNCALSKESIFNRNLCFLPCTEVEEGGWSDPFSLVIFLLLSLIFFSSIFVVSCSLAVAFPVEIIPGLSDGVFTFFDGRPLFSFGKILLVI